MKKTNLLLQRLFPPKPPKQEVKVVIPQQWQINADGTLKPLSVTVTVKKEQK
jgi:hypothetical protein